MEFNYGDHYKLYEDQLNAGTVHLENIGKDKNNYIKLKVNDLTKETPDFIAALKGQKDVMLVTDPPCNATNIRTFYTKAEKEVAESIENFNKKYGEWIAETKPRWIFFECFKSNKQHWIDFLKEHYKHVEVVESMYYYQEKNKCWFICATNDNEPISKQFPELPCLEGNKKIDEEMFIRWISKNVPFSVSVDLCSGQGQHFYWATLFGKNAVGTELNLKRAGMALYRLSIQDTWGDKAPSKIK